MLTVTHEAVRRAEVVADDPAAAVDAIVERLHGSDAAGVLFFCSADYDPDALAGALRGRFACPVVGCTTAGEIGARYQEHGVVALSFSREHFRFHPRLIGSMADFDHAAAKDLTDALRGELEFTEDFDAAAMFGVTLLDGLSVLEESVVAMLHSSAGGIDLIGGSAGDSLKFEQTRVYADGGFHTGAGVFLVIESKLPFRIFKLQHFEPSELDLVITEADPETRIVTEINGGPAAEEYAEVLGMDIDTLNPQTFARHPVMLQLGDEWYVRSIQKVESDGSLRFYCAIDEGLPLTVARGTGFVETLEAKIVQLQDEFSTIEATLGFDCILRRVELTETELTSRVEEALAKLNFVGFSTFGEQYGAVHVNQTLTGVVFGRK